MKKILLVDNDPIMLRMMAGLLEKKGHRAATAEDGLKALDMLMEYTPDVIIVDLVMPNIDGKMLCRIIRNIPRLKDAYLIILSAIAAEEKINIAQLGVNECIAKGPFNETAKHVLDILNQPDLSSSKRLTEEVYGIDNVYPRSITEELLSVKRHFEMLLETINEGILEVNATGRIVYANSTALTLIAVSEEDLLGTHFLDLFDQDGRGRVADLMANDGSRPSDISRDKAVCLNQHQILLDLLPLEAGGDAALIVLSDLSEQKKTESALRKTNKLLQNILDNSLCISIVSTDRDQNILFWNKGAENIFGYTSEEVVGRRKIDILYPEDEARRVTQEIRPSVINKKKAGSYEIKEITKDGRTLWMHLNLSPRFDDDGHVVGLLGIGEDISERKLAEQALRESEIKLARSRKMESLGLMAGGIAHDLNNILSGIVSYPDIILMDLSQDDPLRTHIETIKDAGLRAADVVADLLTIARGVATRKEVLNLNDVIADYLSSVEHVMTEKLKPSIIYTKRLEPGLLNISGSASHIKKILLNLVVNASEACREDGTVTVATTNRYLDEPLKGYEDIRRGEYVLLTVEDDGIGISPDHIERIFEPFYTKKALGKSGTGLGLAVVWNIVQDHEGYINVKSGREGTLFEIFFPVSRGEAAAENERTSVEDYVGHGESILVVDDEENQRKIACELLTRIGYRVEAVSSGEAAVEFLKHHSVDLIVLDMIMLDGMNGRQTYEAVIKMKPQQKAIVISGFAETDDVKAVQRLGAGQYIKKPYTLEKIGVAVRDELETGADGKNGG